MLGGVQNPYITINTIQSTDQCLDWLSWPNVEYPDIFNYFVTSVSTYTKQQLKAYKSLEGYRYFVDGWIQEGFVWLVPSKTKLVLCCWELQWKSVVILKQVLPSVPKLLSLLVLPFAADIINVTSDL